jgi:anti-sigma B factor antagonist
VAFAQPAAGLTLIVKEGAMPEVSSPIAVSQHAGIFVCEFTTSKILDESNIKEIGDTLNSLIDRNDYHRLLLDFSNVEHLSSAALGMLINANNRLRQRNGQLRLTRIRPQIMEVFTITKLNKLFKIVPGKDEALASFTK